MLTSLSLIFLVGLSMAFICRKIKLPRIIGMLITGIALGPFVLDLLDPKILGISSELRQTALIIILIKAGLSLNISDLKKVGRPAVLMSFLPALFEIGAFVLLAPRLLHITVLDSAIMGAVLGAVSPAVVVPRMVQLMDENCGTDKQIPQLINLFSQVLRLMMCSSLFCFPHSSTWHRAVRQRSWTLSTSRSLSYWGSCSARLSDLYLPSSLNLHTKEETPCVKASRRSS